MNKKKAILVMASGDVEEIESEWGVSEINNAVGGFFDLVRFGKLPFIAYVHDEGKLIDLPENKIVTSIWYDSGQRILLGDYIAGDALLIGDVDVEGNDTSVPDDLINTVLIYQKRFDLYREGNNNVNV